MEDKKENHPKLSPNYVTILDLRDRWVKQKAQQQEMGANLGNKLVDDVMHSKLIKDSNLGKDEERGKFGRVVAGKIVRYSELRFGGSEPDSVNQKPFLRGVDRRNVSGEEMLGIEASCEIDGCDKLVNDQTVESGRNFGRPVSKWKKWKERKALQVNGCTQESDINCSDQLMKDPTAKVGRKVSKGALRKERWLKNQWKRTANGEGDKLSNEELISVTNVRQEESNSVMEKQNTVLGSGSSLSELEGLLPVKDIAVLVKQHLLLEERVSVLEKRNGVAGKQHLCAENGNVGIDKRNSKAEREKSVVEQTVLLQKQMLALDRRISELEKLSLVTVKGMQMDAVECGEGYSEMEKRSSVPMERKQVESEECGEGISELDDESSVSLERNVVQNEECEETREREVNLGDQTAEVESKMKDVSVRGAYETEAFSTDGGGYGSYRRIGHGGFYGAGRAEHRAHRGYGRGGNWGNYGCVRAERRVDKRDNGRMWVQKGKVSSETTDCCVDQDASVKRDL